MSEEVEFTYLKDNDQVVVYPDTASFCNNENSNVIDDVVAVGVSQTTGAFIIWLTSGETLFIPKDAVVIHGSNKQPKDKVEK